MPQKNFHELLKSELKRIDESQTAKRHEKVIEGFSSDRRAIIHGKPYLIFNSNDYLGLRFSQSMRKAEEDASRKYGTGPGAVRFISGTLKVHRELEDALAKFHGREAGMVFSSCFAANLAVLHCIIKGQSRDSVVHSNTLVISDELNHRSIIDGIRVAGLEKEQKAIFKHMDLDDLDKVLEANKGKFKRVMVVTDGIFSMLGEYQDIKRMQEVIDNHQDDFEEGIISVVDDSHGVGAFGEGGRGAEGKSGGKCDLLVGTFGKGFGSDGGYVVGDKLLIDYLRESSATYIYSNCISPGTAASAFESIRIIDSPEGERLLASLNGNISYFKERVNEAGFRFACDSSHGIQPILIGDAAKTKGLADELFRNGVIVTNINFPVVPKGKDEIRVQISAVHTRQEIDEFMQKLIAAGSRLGII